MELFAHVVRHLRRCGGYRRRLIVCLAYLSDIISRMQTSTNLDFISLVIYSTWANSY